MPSSIERGARRRPRPSPTGRGRHRADWFAGPAPCTRHGWRRARGASSRLETSFLGTGGIAGPEARGRKGERACRWRLGGLLRKGHPASLAMPAEKRFDREGSRVSAAHGLDDRGKGRENIATVGTCAKQAFPHVRMGVAEECAPVTVGVGPTVTGAQAPLAVSGRSWATSCGNRCAAGGAPAAPSARGWRRRRFGIARRTSSRGLSASGRGPHGT